jgi:hypothetical protein
MSTIIVVRKTLLNPKGGLVMAKNDILRCITDSEFRENTLKEKKITESDLMLLIEQASKDIRPKCAMI